MADALDLGNLVTMGQLLEFEVAFPGEQPLTLEQYLAGGNKGLILNAAAFFLGFKSYKSEFSDPARFLEMFFREENNDIANQIYKNIQEIQKTGNQIGIINAYSSLRLFEYFFSRPEVPETQTQVEFERNLFKAY